jgi:hypothetical protein
MFSIVVISFNFACVCGIVPSFCVDPAVQRIFERRIHGCLGGSSVTNELSTLKVQNIHEYQRAHELLAYNYFLSDHNSHRENDCAAADFEYIPLLPLAWKIGVPTQTECTAGGYCPRSEIPSQLCSVEELVQSIVEYMQYVNTRPHHLNRPRFVVASTFNLKAVLGFGLPLQQRRGIVFNTVTTFIENTMIGHYERLPQCADLLRKPWQHVVELPFISHDLYHDITSPSPSFLSQSKPWNFFFGGRLLLWGSERVCSVRVVIAHQVATRQDAIVFNITKAQSFGPPINDTSFFGAMRDSIFCLIARADSYSSAAFYNAIQSGCIPVVISDWFVFSFWWLVPYREFVVRIPEQLFLTDANAVLDHIVHTFSQERISRMQDAMRAWRDFLRFQSLLPTSTTNTITTTQTTPVNVFEALLLEMQQAHIDLASSAKKLGDGKVVSRSVPQSGNGSMPVVCRDPIACAPEIVAVALPSKSKQDPRTHICKHAARLIGKYKIVYFMQCVKMLWPLRPGNFLPRPDLSPGGLTESEVDFVKVFHNLSGAPSNYIWDIHPILQDRKKIRLVASP